MFFRDPFLGAHSLVFGCLREESLWVFRAGWSRTVLKVFAHGRFDASVRYASHWDVLLEVIKWFQQVIGIKPLVAKSG